MKRWQLLDLLAQAIGRVYLPHPLRVGIDGIDAAGKTSLADELAAILRLGEREVVRASLDSFHNPREVRYTRGPLSPEGYYLDSFNYPLLRQSLLDPLGPGGSRVFQAAAYDVLADRPLTTPLQQVSSNAVLLFDGVFLFRPELTGCWDLSIYLEISFEESLCRALTRDLPVLGSREVIEERYRMRYIPGQKLYLAACCPRDTADWVIDYELPETPALIASSPRAKTV